MTTDTSLQPAHHPTAATTTAEHRAAVLLIEHTVLAQLLQLPPGSYIDHVEAPCDRPGTLRMRVRGAGWPVMLGHLLKQATGRLTHRFTPEGDELLYEIDWGFREHSKQQNEGPCDGN